MEIIEIGATLVAAADARELDHFQRFVRPVRRPLLTHFCRDLTHISQANVDGAAHLDTVWEAFERWLAQHRPRLAGWASWGDYDRRQLEQEWRQHGLTSQLSEVPHVNLKQRFGEVRQLPRPVGLNAALQLAGMSFQGQQHRALEDARNTARLLPLVLPVGDEQGPRRLVTPFRGLGILAGLFKPACSPLQEKPMFKVNEYFDGTVKSIAFDMTAGPATIGVMAAGEYVGTSQLEIMHVVAGALTSSCRAATSGRNTPAAASSPSRRTASSSSRSPRTPPTSANTAEPGQTGKPAAGRFSCPPSSGGGGGIEVRSSAAGAACLAHSALRGGSGR